MAEQVVRPEVLASWARTLRDGVDLTQVATTFSGRGGDSAAEVACADDVFAEFLAANGPAAFSLVLLDPSGVVRVRQDGERGIADLLDDVLLLPGYEFGERAVGTTAASVALAERADSALVGAEHLHYQLTCFSDAAALVRDGSEDIRGVVVVLCHDAESTMLQSSLARLLAQQISTRLAAEPDRRSRAVVERFTRCEQQEWAWVVATDGQFVQTSAAVRRLEPADERALVDLVLLNLVERDFGERHVDLPSGQCAEVTAEGIHLGGELVGCVLVGDKVEHRRPPVLSEAVRRQGAHVAPTARRDFARDLRRTSQGRSNDRESRVRANRELLTPYLRAQHEVIMSVAQLRNRLLTGEPGVGKQTLAVSQFRRRHPRGRVITIDCATLETAPELPVADQVHQDLRDDGRPRLLMLRGLNTLTSVGTRRVDMLLRPLTALPAPPLLIGCVDNPAVDATRPYGLLLKHFHEITRVPSLRYRVDEIGDIARSILRELSVRRSLRLSLQVLRVLEGYAWPGNISELKDVLKYVVARKPVGEVQPPDLPSLCFQGRAHKLTMLEAAQCDTIIQALYESRGNRYKAASMLGIARSSLYRKLDAFGISYIA